MIDNPYEAPKELPHENVVPQTVRRLAAIGFLSGSVGFVVIYMSILLQLIPRHLPIPVWPAILVPLVLSILSAIRTRSLFIAPLACVCGVSSGSLMFAAVRGWDLAEAPIVIPFSVLLSAPSFLIANYSPRSAVAPTSSLSSDSHNHGS